MGTPEIWRFVGGHANLTYLLRYADREFILRRPPLGKLPPGAHDMRREHLVLSRLGDAYPLAPRSYLLCEDEDVIGAVFMVAERRHGVTIPGADLPQALQGDRRFAERLGGNLVDALADLHQVDPARVGLESLGNSDGFLPRQLAGWSKRWTAALETPPPHTEALLRWFEANIPPSSRTSLIHNDYKLDNLLLRADDPAVPVAVLDWDMCTRGDPLMDLGYLLTYWGEPGDPPDWIAASPMPTTHPGFGPREAVIERYAERTGFPVHALPWHRAFAAFKLAAILQQIYIRYVRGQTTDPRFAGFAPRIATMLRKAEALAAG